MAETLLSGSAILMYGRVMTDIQFKQGAYVSTSSTLNHLQSQLSAQRAQLYALASESLIQRIQVRARSLVAQQTVRRAA